MQEILPRSLQKTVLRRLEEEPVVVLTGARTAGKSTLLRQIAESARRRVVDLDDLSVREAAEADPARFVAGPSPVLIEEFQHVPELLDAIKAELNRDLRPGRFVLTGSTRYFAIPRTAQSLTGRVHLLNLWPFSQGEIEQATESFLDLLITEPAGIAAGDSAALDRDDVTRRILAGGFPLALRRSSSASRRRWFADYVSLVVTRDVLDIRRVRQPEVLPALLRRLASQTGRVLNMSKAARGVGGGLEPSVADDYTKLLEAVFLLHRLPAWGRTLRSRVGALPKLHLGDSGLAAHLLAITEERLDSLDPPALTEFGHVAETFAVNEILKQADWSDRGLRFGHFRTHDGDEVDLVVERDDGRVATVEIKASSRVRRADLKGTRFLRDALGDAFLGGIVLSLGERPYRAEDRIHVVPMDRLWR